MIQTLAGIWLFGWMLAVATVLLDYPKKGALKGWQETVSILLYCLVLILLWPRRVYWLGKQILKGNP